MELLKQRRITESMVVNFQKLLFRIINYGANWCMVSYYWTILYVHLVLNGNC